MQLLPPPIAVVLASLFLVAPIPNPEGKVLPVGVLKHEDMTGVLGFTPDGRGLVVVVFDKSQVIVWDLETMKQRTVMDHKNTASLRYPIYAPSGKLVVTVGQDADVEFRAPSRVRVWDPAAGKELAAVPARPSAWVALSPDAKFLAVSDWDSWKDQGAVRLFDAATAKEVVTVAKITIPVYRVGFSPDGQTLAMSSGDHKNKRGEVRLWDVATRKVRATLTGSMDLMCFRFSPDGRAIVTWSPNEDGGAEELKLWDAATGRLKAELKGCGAPVWVAAFSPDGRLLATAGGHDDPNFIKDPDGKVVPDPANGEVKLWDVATGKELASLKGHTALVRDLAFSRDGRLLATAGGDKYEKRGEFMLWDVATRKRLATPTGHSDVVTTVAFSPGGKVLASGSSDGTVRLWDVSGLGRAPQ